MKKSKDVVVIMDNISSSLVQHRFKTYIDNLPNSVFFIICSSGVFIFYLLYGYLLELIFTLEGMELHGWYLTLVQFALYSIFAMVQLSLSGNSFKAKVPLSKYGIIALLTVGTMGFSNTSMGYLNYPTQVIFKSCKLIPVMIGSVIILRKRYSFIEVISCILMSLGLIWITLADSTIQPKFSLQGVLYVSIALIFDAVIGNVQEGVIRKYDENTTRVVLFSYFLGFILILFGLIMSGRLCSSLIFSFLNPWEIYGRAVFLSLAGFCGVQAVLVLVKHYGALLAVTVTTFRKAFSIILSFFFFTKPFTIQYAWGALLVTFAIYLNILAKRQKDSGSFIRIPRYFYRIVKILTVSKQSRNNEKISNKLFEV